MFVSWSLNKGSKVKKHLLQKQGYSYSLKQKIFLSKAFEVKIGQKLKAVYTSSQTEELTTTTN